MKTTILSAATIAAALVLSSSASAESQAPAVEPSASAAQAPAAINSATQPRHSHMGEKLGVRAEQAASSGSEAAKSKAAKANLRHNHQRDSK